MASYYKLLFRGAVHADQHAAVVRPRLQALLKATDAQMDIMFSGKAVTIKKSVDEATAEKYVDAFYNAGAKLELVEAAAPVAPAAPATPEPAVAGDQASHSDQNPERSPQQAETSAFQLAAVGTPLVAEADRAEDVVPTVATDHLTLANPGAMLGSDADSLKPDAVAVVDTSHLQLDQPGVRLGVPQTEATDMEQLLNFDFELGEVGEVLVKSSPPVEPVLPDLSHLQLEAVVVDTEDPFEA